MTTENQAELIAEAIRCTYDSMSQTDRKNIQAAILRAQRKAMAKQINALKPQKEQA
jgi:hypothetical protein